MKHTGSSVTYKNCCLTWKESSIKILVFSQKRMSTGKMKCAGFSLEGGLGKNRHSWFLGEPLQPQPGQVTNLVSIYGSCKEKILAALSKR